MAPHCIIGTVQIVKVVNAPGPCLEICPENAYSAQVSDYLVEPLPSCNTDLPSFEGLTEQEVEQAKQLLNKYQIFFHY